MIQPLIHVVRLAILVVITHAFFSTPGASQAPDSHPLVTDVPPVVQLTNRTLSQTNLKDRMAHYRVPGVSIAVMRGGKITDVLAIGVKDENTDKPVESDTLFQAASISKPAFATVLMAYRDRHGLDLETPVNRLMTSWQINGVSEAFPDGVTLRRLLSHTAGTTVHGFAGYKKGEAVPTLIQLLDGASPANSPAVTVDIQPFSQFRYSGGGTSVAELVFRDVTGKSLPTLADDLLFQPLDMQNSYFVQPLPDTLMDQAANAHDQLGNTIEGGAHTYAAMAAAGLWTTPSDILTWGASIWRASNGSTGEVVSPEAARDMLNNPLGPVGIGFFIDGEGGGCFFWPRRFERGLPVQLLCL